MFSKGSLTDRYKDAVYVRIRTRKVAKICAILYMILFGLLIVATVFASNLVENGVTAGALVLALSGFPLGYLSGHICGSCLSWTYYWLERKHHMEAPILLTMFIAAYVGLFIWLKYRKTAKKLDREIRRQSRTYP